MNVQKKNTVQQLTWRMPIAPLERRKANNLSALWGTLFDTS